MEYRNIGGEAMFGLNKSQIKHEITFRVSEAINAYPENHRHVIESIIEGVSETIDKNIREIERKLRDAGVNI
jgi:hypothetical protein